MLHFFSGDYLKSKEIHHTYVQDVLRLIRAQDVHRDLLAVAEADVQGDVLCGNLLRLLWEWTRRGCDRQTRRTLETVRNEAVAVRRARVDSNEVN